MTGGIIERGAAYVRQRDGAALLAPERDATGPVAAAHETAIAQRPAQAKRPRRYRPKRYCPVRDQFNNQIGLIH